MRPLIATLQTRLGMSATMKQLTDTALRRPALASSSSRPSKRWNTTQADWLTKQNFPPLAAVPPIARSRPHLYASLLPRQSSQLHALLARVHLPHDDPELLHLLNVALTHPSWIAQRNTVLEQSSEEDLGDSLSGALKAARSQTGPQSHVELATLGNTLVGCLASESLHLAYPNLPNRVLKAALSAHVGPNSLADVAVELGVSAKGLIKWDPASQVARKDGSERALTFREVLADSMRAVLAIIFQAKGMASARNFIISHFLSRLPIPPSDRPALSSTSIASSHSIAPLLKFTDPKRAFSLYCQKHGKPAPQSRLIAETGRLSNSAVFGVGVYSGSRRLGEGWGSNIAMAEYRAAEDALRRVMLAKSADLAEEEIPSGTLDDVFAGSQRKREHVTADSQSSSTPGPRLDRNIWDVGNKVAEEGGPASPRTFRPRPLGQSEIVFGSKA